MKVDEIMSCPVETIDFNAAISEAAERMESLNVGVLPVMKNNQIVGMITDRDIVIRVIAKKLDPQKTVVNEAMTDEVICCNEDASMDEAARLMEEKQVHRLLILGSDNSLVGILSVGDIAVKMKDEHILREVLQCVCEQTHNC